LYDAHLQVRNGAGGYVYPGEGGYDYRMYDYPTQGVYHAPAYEAVPRDAMVHDPGYDVGHGYGPRYDVGHGYDARPGYEYPGHYGGSYVPRQVPVPIWAPQQQQYRSSGCVLD